MLQLRVAQPPVNGLPERLRVSCDLSNDPAAGKEFIGSGDPLYQHLHIYIGKSPAVVKWVVVYEKLDLQ